ncbi:MAG: YeeE/YedE family protein [Sandaracinus sp.]|nr:YeeE/YedE family protein [Sandaracinus sp.]MCB9612988.1 YeeE/YedE family protein [Sandaracinus sp.]MCB9619132.1 YeeE/YedE family protein [Sandaracinus sp.]MCB9632715.1 YeeE/YedE family protein [Sandaracinus sp.]
MNKKQYLAAFGTGLLFAFGLALSGMTLPSKVIGFFDFSDGLTSWDPSLAFVMGGGVLVYLPVWRLVKGRARPLFDERFRLPTRKDIDGRLLLGAALFGIGWGLGGYCPGPALTSVGSFSSKALVMVASMLLGMVGFQQLDKLRARSKAAREVPSNGKVAS